MVRKVSSFGYLRYALAAGDCRENDTTGVEAKRTRAEEGQKNKVISPPQSGEIWPRAEWRTLFGKARYSYRLIQPEAALFAGGDRGRCGPVPG